MSQQIDVSFGCSPVCSTNYESISDKTPTEAITEAVAAAEGVDPTRLPPLYESIETDAVNRLFDHSGEESPPTKALCFVYSGWNVFVRSDGTIIVGDPADDSESTSLLGQAACD
jgi:hypothetical protein